MIFDTKSSQMLESGLDAMWLKMRVGVNNISNYDTPNYKAKQVDFHEALRECQSPKHGGDRVKERFIATVTSDEQTEARVDGSNVSMEKEQLDLFRTQAQYAFLSQKISGYYNNIRTVINQFGK